uniref:Uncharacterized protein n=1 Tax=Arundo donax TaxID=35708 RepID=A0A0A8ZVP6_ARUDO
MYVMFRLIRHMLVHTRQQTSN